jgi:hypothetical protein
MTEFKFRTLENGHVCCSSYDDAGQPIAPQYPCDACVEHQRTAEADESAAWMHPYATDLAKLRSANAQPDAQQQAKLRALTDNREPELARLTDLSAYAPPSAYGQALREHK